MLLRLFKIVGYIFAAIVIITIVVLSLSLQTSPSFKSNQVVDANVANNAKLLLTRIKNNYQPNKRQNQVLINSNELLAISAIISRVHPDVLVLTKIKSEALQNQLSWKLPFSIIDLYLNVQINILSSKQGLKRGNVSVGDIELSGMHLLYFIKQLVNLLQPELGTQLQQSIKSILLTKNKVQISYQIPAAFQLKRFQGRGRLVALRDELALFGNVIKISFYYKRLLHFINKAPAPQKLAPYLVEMISLAQQQVIINEGKNAKSENQAALLALIIYFGSPNFELMIGDISHLSLKESRQKQYLINNVRLSGRNDLQQHFIYSLALQLISTVRVSYTVGELKELLDSNIGGSGFSFADLMADRAGTRFAMLATRTDASAVKIQAKITLARQALFKNTTHQLILLPHISGLPEGLNQFEFEKKYQNVNSPAYQKMISSIEQHLSTLAIYQKH